MKKSTCSSPPAPSHVENIAFLFSFKLHGLRFRKWKEKILDPFFIPLPSTRSFFAICFSALMLYDLLIVLTVEILFSLDESF